MVGTQVRRQPGTHILQQRRLTRGPVLFLPPPLLLSVTICAQVTTRALEFPPLMELTDMNIHSEEHQLTTLLPEAVVEVLIRLFLMVDMRR